MAELFNFSIISGIFIATGYLTYRLLLAHCKQNSLNRRCLIGIYLLSLVAMPLLNKLPDRGLLQNANPTHEATRIELEPLSIIGVTVSSEDAITIYSVVVAIYSAGFLIVLAISLGGYIRLWRLIASGRKERTDNGYALIRIDRDIVPFSFGQYIVVGDNCATDFAMILAHEQTHMQQCHWLDLILAQAVCVLMWYNPAAWLMRRQLRDVHEYIADEAVIAAGFDVLKYQNFLIEKATGTRLQSLANSLNHSNIYKRIAMMYKKSPSGAMRLRVLGFVPAMLVATAICSASPIASTIRMASAEKTSPAKRETTNKVTKLSPNSKHLVTDKLPSYPGGMDAMIRFLIDNLRYPEEAMKAGRQGRVIVEFTVETDGSLSDVTIRNGIAPDLDAEAVRVVKAMPRWNPGVNQAGEPVRCIYVLPVSFALKADDKK